MAKENDMADKKPFASEVKEAVTPLDKDLTQVKDSDEKKEVKKVDIKNDPQQKEVKVEKKIESSKKETEIEEKIEPQQKEIKYGGRQRMQLRPGKRFWMDYATGWDIYARESRISPVRWSRNMKAAVAKGTLLIIDKGPKRDLTYQPREKDKIYSEKMKKESEERKQKIITNSGSKSILGINTKTSNNKNMKSKIELR